MRKSSILVAFEAPMHNDVMYVIDAVNDMFIYSGRSVRIDVFLAKITVGQAWGRITRACSWRLSILAGRAQRRQWLRINFTVAAGCCVMMGCGRFDGPQLKREPLGALTL